MAPHRGAALFAVPKYLPQTARGISGVFNKFAGRHLDAGRFNQDVDCEGRTGFFLTPVAMSAMHEQRLACELILQGAVGALAGQFALVGSCVFLAHFATCPSVFPLLTSYDGRRPCSLCNFD